MTAPIDDEMHRMIEEIGDVIHRASGRFSRVRDTDGDEAARELEAVQVGVVVAFARWLSAEAEEDRERVEQYAARALGALNVRS